MSADASDAPVLQRTRWRAFWHPVPQIDFDALSQAAAALRAELDLQRVAAGEDRPERVALENTIEGKLDAIDPRRPLELNWSLINHAERLVLALLPEARVRLELQRRADRMRHDGVPFAAFYETALEALEQGGQNPGTLASARRELLHAMVGDLQLFTGRRFIRRRYARLAIYKVGLAFVAAFALFLIVLTVGHWFPPAVDAGEAEVARAAPEEKR